MKVKSVSDIKVEIDQWSEYNTSGRFWHNNTYIHIHGLLRQKAARHTTKQTKTRNKT